MTDVRKPILRDIYAYTTESDSLNNRVKIGETVDQEVDDRIRQQDSTSNSEKLEKIGEIPGTPWSDNQIRKEIVHLNLGRVHRKEWMVIAGGVNNALSAIQKAINSLQLGIPRANSYAMRSWQQKCHDKAVAAFKTGFLNFLMGTVMRFGKTFTSLMVAQTLGAQNVLVITGKPEVRDSWKNELEQHVNFADWNFIDLRDSTLLMEHIDFTKKNLFFVSFQYFTAEAEGVDKTWIHSLPIDLLLTDEEHHASKTDMSRAILGKFGSLPTMAMSGTPNKSRLSGRYGEENSFYWSYREAAESDPAFPKLNIFVISVDQEVSQEAAAAGFVDENAFHINKMFATENGKFLYESDVRNWVEKVFDLRPMSRTRRMDSPEHISGLQSKNFNHILVRVPPSVDAAVALRDLLTEVLQNREIILAAGSANGAVRNISEVKRLIAQNAKTVTVTCGRFETGVTVPEWGAVYLCDGGRSPEAFWQLIFRASTPHSTDSWKKKEFYVFDFDPHRALEMMYTSASINRDPGKDMGETISQWLDVAPILQHDGSKFTEIKAESVLRVFDTMTAGSMLERYASEFGIRDIYNEAVLEILSEISASGKQRLIQAIANNPGLEKGQQKKIIAKVTSPSDAAEIQGGREKLKTILRRMPMVAVGLGAVDLYSLLALGEQNKEYFKSTVGVSLDEYRTLINEGAVDSVWQDECIISTTNYLQRIGQDEESLWKILGLYASMGSEVSPGTSKQLASEMLCALPDGVWTDHTKTFCVPNLSDGTFYYLIVEKLMRGLSDEFPNPENRLRHILTEQLFGFDHKIGPLRFVRAIAERYYNTQDLGIEISLIHKNILEGEQEMKFDVVVGNPPYQQSDGGGGRGSSAKSIYNNFVEKVKEWDPEVLSFVIPARWTVGGKGLTKFRKKMLNDKNISLLKIYPNSKECFPDNDIKGGICYFIRDTNHEGPCRVIVKSGDYTSSDMRKLDEIGDDIFVVNKLSCDIINKIAAKSSLYMNETVSSSKPFGLRSFYKSDQVVPFQDSVKLYQTHGTSHVKRSEILNNKEWIEDYKVLIPKASDGRGGMQLQVLGHPIVADPGSACTETYLVMGRFDNAKEAQNMASFLKTRFVRFLVSIVKKTQNGSKNVFRFVPQIEMTKEWLDEELYERYNLTQEEIDFIEKKIKVMA